MPPQKIGRSFARLDFCNSLLREPDELRGVKRLVQIADVNQVMRHAGAFGGRRLGGADVQAAIDLHRVHGDDFAADFFRERQRGFRFAHGGRPGEEDRCWTDEQDSQVETPAIMLLKFILQSCSSCRSVWFGGGCRRDKNGASTIPADKNWHADKLRGGQAGVDVVGRIVAPKVFDDGTEDRIDNQIGCKNLAVEFFAAEQPREENVENQVQQRVVNFRRMHAACRGVSWSAGK